MLTMLDFGFPTVTDLVDSAPTISNNAPRSFPSGVTIITWTSIDDSGNRSTATQRITIQDTTSPMIVLPADIIAEATNVLTVLDIGTSDATDNVDYTITNDSPESFPLGTTTVTWTVSDSSGNTISDTQRITIQDTTIPVFDSIDNIISDDAIIEFDLPQATDIFPVTITCNYLSGDTFEIGTTIVTCTATDDNDNSIRMTFRVIVNQTIPSDDTPPEVTELSAPDRFKGILDAENRELDFSWSKVNNADGYKITKLFHGSFVEILDVRAPDIMASYTLHPDTYQDSILFEIAPYSDTIQSDVSKRVKISVPTLDFLSETIPDTTPPVFAPVDDITSNDQNVNFDIPTATDISPVIVECDYSSGDLFPVGTTTITCNAVDDSGNSAIISFDVIVELSELSVFIEDRDIIFNQGEIYRFSALIGDDGTQRTPFLEWSIIGEDGMKTVLDSHVTTVKVGDALFGSTYTLHLDVKFSQVTISDSVQFTIIGNPPPVIQIDDENEIIAENDMHRFLVTIDRYGYDVDISNVIWSITNSNGDQTFLDQYTLFPRVGEGLFGGSYTLKVIVVFRDGLQITDSTQFTKLGNPPPVIQIEDENEIIQQGTNHRFSTTIDKYGYDVDISNVLWYVIDSNGDQIDLNQHTLSPRVGKGLDIGVYTLLVDVTFLDDYTISDSIVFSIV